MIEVTVYEAHAELKVLPDPEERKDRKQDFFRDLERIKNDIHHRDRQFDPAKKVWIVKNLEAYGEVPYIYYAVELRKHQLTLF